MQKKAMILLITLIICIGYKFVLHQKDERIQENRVKINGMYTETVDKFKNDSFPIAEKNKTVDDLVEESTINIEGGSQPEEDVNEKRKNYNVVGKIQIQKIEIEYVIIDGASKDNLNISVCKVAGNEINKEGNFVIAGHNMKNGSQFGKLKKLNVGDTLKLYDLKKKSQEYRIYRKKIIDPSDLSPLYKDTKRKKKVTLITCSNRGKKRMVLYAEAI